MEAILPYKSVVLFIACGTMVFAIVFVFVKRQITRFALKSNRVPHAVIGANVPKSLRQKIENRLKRVEEIKFEPRLLSETAPPSPELEKCHAYFRMKAVDGVKQFDVELSKLYTTMKRPHGECLRRFLLDQQLDDTGCLHGINLEIIDKFSLLYEHARHDPAPFKQEQYQEFMDLLNHLIEYMKKKHEKDYADGKITESTEKNVDISADDKKLHNLSQSDSSKTEERARLLVGATAIAAASTINNDECLDDLHEKDTNSSTATVKDAHVVIRPRKMTGSDSGTFLLTRHSGSSQGSTIETEATFRCAGVLHEDGESFV